MNSLPEPLHQLIGDEEDARACKDIEKKQCDNQPRNYLLILLAQLFTKLADSFASAKVVLPFAMNAAGVPVFLSGLLVPIRESGSLLPQLFIGGWVRRFPLRKTFFSSGCILQALSISGIALSLSLLSGMIAGVCSLLLLMLFSLARGLCSVASKDVLGKTISKGKRGNLTGTSASLAGLVSIVFAITLMYSNDWLTNSSVLLLTAAICWLTGAVIYQLILENKGDTTGGKNGFKLAIDNLSLLKQHPQLRQFVLVRSLLMSSALSSPYFILSNGSDDFYQLGLYMLLAGIASFVSGRLWGNLADKSSRMLLLITALCTCVICAAGATISYISPGWQSGIFAILFLLMSITHQGVRVARKTYVVDMAEGNQRTDFVSLSNSIIGVVLLVFGALTAMVAQFSQTGLFILFALSALLALYQGRKLPDVSRAC
ncbi:MFS transporter [Neptunicella marina]|uniref:MFS transporter n=1 Tax=Neptunicella marina TaxID=2125989 RepID=A0A8J6LZV8_9ALTE|nr:MFS transporter [Neptunicella marina]MBC3766839.1 MFS transporter [Neptunicella marina]